MQKSWILISIVLTVIYRTSVVAGIGKCLEGNELFMDGKETLCFAFLNPTAIAYIRKNIWHNKAPHDSIPTRYIAERLVDYTPEIPLSKVSGEFTTAWRQLATSNHVSFSLPRADNDLRMTWMIAEIEKRFNKYDCIAVWMENSHRPTARFRQPPDWMKPGKCEVLLMQIGKSKCANGVYNLDCESPFYDSDEIQFVGVYTFPQLEDCKVESRTVCVPVSSSTCLAYRRYTIKKHSVVGFGIQCSTLTADEGKQLGECPESLIAQCKRDCEYGEWDLQPLDCYSCQYYMRHRPLLQEAVFGGRCHRKYYVMAQCQPCRSSSLAGTLLPTMLYLLWKMLRNY